MTNEGREINVVPDKDEQPPCPSAAVSTNNSDKESNSTCSTSKKRRLTGFDVEPYVRRIDLTKPQGACVLLCCDHKMAFNVTRVRGHLRTCRSFRSKIPNAYKKLLKRSTSNVLQTKRKIEDIGDYFITISSEKRRRLDQLFASAVLKDGDSFSTCQSKNWKPFFKEAFGGSYHPPHRTKISDEFLPSVHEKCQDAVRKELKPHQLCVSIDGFTEITSRSVFNFMVSTPIPFHIDSFRLGTARETSKNVDETVSKLFRKHFSTVGNELLLSYGLVTDSPSVMTKARRMATGTDQKALLFLFSRMVVHVIRYR